MADDKPDDQNLYIVQEVLGWGIPGLQVIGGAVATAYGGGAVGVPLITSGVAGLGKQAGVEVQNAQKRQQRDKLAAMKSEQVGPVGSLGGPPVARPDSARQMMPLSSAASPAPVARHRMPQVARSQPGPARPGAGTDDLTVQISRVGSAVSRSATSSRRPSASAAIGDASAGRGINPAPRKRTAAAGQSASASDKDIGTLSADERAESEPRNPAHAGQDDQDIAVLSTPEYRDDAASLGDIPAATGAPGSGESESGLAEPTDTDMGVISADLGTDADASDSGEFSGSADTDIAPVIESGSDSDE